MLLEGKDQRELKLGQTAFIFLTTNHKRQNKTNKADIENIVYNITSMPYALTDVQFWFYLNKKTCSRRF